MEMINVSNKISLVIDNPDANLTEFHELVIKNKD